jgi:RNA polymerase sigma-70 factor, ECF subfamily
MQFSREYKQEFTRLFQGCEAWLYSYLFSLLMKAEDAEEVFQETAKLCWEKFDQYQPKTEFRAWACRIAHFKALEFRKRRKKEPLNLTDLFFNEIDVEAIVMADQLDARMAALNQCMKRLPAGDRKLLKLRYALNGTTKSTAEIMGRPLHAVYRSLARIHNILYYCITQTLSKEEG